MTRILLTGAGGVLGSELLAQLRERQGVDVTGVTSRGDPARGVLAWRLGREPAPPALSGPWDVVIHSAADTRWNLAPEESWEANVGATAALDAVVGPRTHLVHVSTAFAPGLRGSTASPELGDYRNPYEWSKAAAERLVAERFPHVTIVRPPLIIGRRRDGGIVRFSGIYAVMRAIATGLAPATVADPDAYGDLAPVDDVAGRIVALAQGPPPARPSVDVIGRGADALRIAEVLATAQAGVNDVRLRHGRPPLPLPPLIDPDSWDRFLLPFARRHLPARQQRLLDLLTNFTPYLMIRAPLTVTARIPDVAPVLRRSLAVWAEQHLGAALADRRPWGEPRAA